MNAFFEKLSRLKALPCILLAVSAGLLLLLLPGKTAADPLQTAEPDASATYKAALEADLSELLCGLDGVKDCAVVITLTDGYEYLYASDQSVRENAAGKETEKKIVLASESGGQSPLLLREKMPRVGAVAVTLRGGDERTRASARSLLSALFGADVRIFVA